MADFRNRRTWIKRNMPSMAPRMVDEEITPSSGWTDFSEFHCLLVDLPGFKKDDIKLNVDESGTIVVSGRRKAGEGKQVHFDKTFNVPEDGDLKSMTMIFEGDTLRVRVPKVTITEKDEQANTIGASSSSNNKKDKEDPNIPALNSSSVPKEDKPGESKSSSSRDKMEKESKSPPISDSSEKPNEIQKEQNDRDQRKDNELESPKEEGNTEKPNEFQKEQNGRDQDDENEINSPKEEESTEKPNECQKEKNDCDKGRENEPDSPKEEENKEKPNGYQKEQNGGKQEKQTELNSPRKEENREKPNEYQKEQKARDQGKESSGPGEKSSQTSVMVKIMENKGILLASIISFTLGVLVSKKFHPPPPN